MSLSVRSSGSRSWADPVPSVPDDEVEKFADALENTPEICVMDPEKGLANLYKSVCQKSVEDLYHMSAFDPAFRNLPQAEELQLWEAEKSTWLLVQMIYPERVSAQTYDAEVPDLDMPYDTDFRLVQNAFHYDKSLKENLVIKRWLEAIAPSFDPTRVRAGYWFRTKNIVKEKKRNNFLLKHSEDTVTELDPDAPHRQQKNLDPDDAFYEKDMIRTLYEYIRRGRLDDAADLCRASNQLWRAASLRGGLYYSDRYLEEDRSSYFSDQSLGLDEEYGAISGNKNHLLWKATCYQIAKEESLDIYERALYAALCGDVERVTPVCHSWEDFLWAYYNALIEAQLHQHFLRRGRTLDPEFSLPSDSDDLTPAEIFDRVSRSGTEELRLSANEPFHLIQALIILNRTDELLRDFRERLLDPSKHLSSWERSHVLRFMAHLVIYLRSIGVSLPEEDGDAIIQSYVSMLVESGKSRVVALYASKLPHDLQVHSYAKFLKTIREDKKTRFEYLSIAYKYNLDVDAILSETVKMIFEEGMALEMPLVEDQPVKFSNVTDPIHPDDEIQIRALEWLTLEVPQYAEALIQSNALLRRFLVHGKINAANALVQSLPQNFIQKEWIEHQDPDDDKLQPGLYEQLHYRALLNCLSHYSRFIEVLYRKPGAKPSTGPRRSLYHQEFAEWSRTLRSVAQAVEEGVLQLMQDNWLKPEVVGQELGGNSLDDERRLYELQRLREIYIPEMVIRLHSTLYESRDVIPGNLEKSLEIANLVADDHLAIYREFTQTGKMPQLLQLLRRSSLAILEVSKNPFKTAVKS
ncbi:uncharacterized protein VTP21DRAFT_4535 [Calcarisporiella thermophila]|uniref:uncharacterized protein n=1 Tax=Calcarisporiella thermophila TaxID=911321 RepID=UPI00374447A4